MWALPALCSSSLRALMSPLCSSRGTLPPYPLCLSPFFGGGRGDTERGCGWVCRQASRVPWVLGWLSWEVAAVIFDCRSPLRGGWTGSGL